MAGDIEVMIERIKEDMNKRYEDDMTELVAITLERGFELGKKYETFEEAVEKEKML